MEVVTTYLYGSLDSNIYMKVPDGIFVPNTNANHNMYCVKLVYVSVWLETIGKNVVQSPEGIPPKQRILE
jgi:hypothetical protein